MTAQANRTAPPERWQSATPAHEPTPAPRTFVVGVRAKLGDDLEGLEAHGDGISFRSPRPLGGGQLLELTLCGLLQVDARVVGCTALADADGGYWIRAAFDGVSPALLAILQEEFSRLAAQEG